MKRKILILMVLLVVAIFASGCPIGGGGAQDTVVIGGKNFTEQDILVFMMRDMIEAHTDINVDTRAFLGGTNVVAQAIERGDLDIYPEYTGTGLMIILDEEAMEDPQEVYDYVKSRYEEERNLTWLEPFGYNNTYAMAMREDHAEELGIETLSELAEHAPNLTLGATQEFLEREDGFIGLQEVYGMTFADTRGLDPGLTYAAVRDGEADVNDAFSTDGRIVAFNLKTLEDDKNLFPPYYAAPVVRLDTLERFPELADALNRMEGILDETTMSELNARVDLEGEDAAAVANEFLRSEGLLE
ncbi:glycine betaine/choline ABC-type transport system substrate-binding protein [Desulfitispora alkaliphila]|uniref:ABC transporter substrate-binding protein n=1 Tax=Desulfitispora alkaliphila TaxID=622674 RepID=UPI003D223357